MVGRAATNFPDRVCDNKASCKKPAHLDQKWARNGCLKFFRHFVHFSIWTLKMVAKAYTWTKWPWFQKNSYFLRLVYQINQFFALIKNPRSKIVTNAYFGHQRAAKLSLRHQKSSNGHISIKFGLNDFSFCRNLFLGSNSASCKMNWKCLKICFLDLNLPCFQVPWPSWKIF